MQIPVSNVSNLFFLGDCPNHGLRKHEKNDRCETAALHTKATLWAHTIPDDEFVRPPVKTTVYLQLWWSCGTSLWYFLEADDKNHSKGTIGFAHEVNPKLDESDWKIMRQWVHGCLQRHQSDCIHQDPFYVPGFELIDCKTRKLVPGDKESDFAALSYVWGSPQPQKDLTGGTSQTQLDRTILPKSVDKVIEDALSCTRKLNIPYLWVDRYCIDQEDKNGTKQHLIQSMDKIYAAAKVTIINVVGNDAFSGLPGVSETPRFSPSRLDLGTHQLVPVVNPNDSIRTSKWATRGWTLQEGLLARRRLVFTGTRVYFQCTQSHCIEGLFGEFRSKEGSRIDFHPSRKTRSFPISVIGSNSSSFSIKSVCNEFTSRDLTSDEDALNACLGIFSRFWKSAKPEYQYCGLPFQGRSEAAFSLSLLWRFDNHRYGYPEEYGPVPFRRAWGPSWSSLAWKGQMSFLHSDLGENFHEFPLFADIKIPRRLEGQDIMSTIGDYMRDIDKGGLYQHWLPYLRISSWIATMRFEHVQGYPDDKFDGVVDCCFGLEKGYIGRGHILPPMWAELLKNDKEFNSSRRLDAIFIAASPSGTIHCLVIHRVVGKNGDRYERLGTCDLYHDSPGITQTEDRFYLPVSEWPSKETRNLECRFETITLV